MCFSFTELKLPYLRNFSEKAPRGNVLLYRCGESGGSDYFNLHFDDVTDRKVKYYPNNANTKNGFFVEVNRALRGLAIEPVDKLPVSWSEIKRKK